MNEVMSEVLIRDFRKSDFDGVLELARLCFVGEFEVMGLDIEHLRETVEKFFGFAGRFLMFLLRILGREPFKFFVAEVDGRVVGTAMVSMQRKVGYISTVMVHPDFRMRGIANRLLERAISYVQKCGLEKAVLHVDSANEPAKNLYIKLGFREFEKLAYLAGNLNTIFLKCDMNSEIQIRNFHRGDVDQVYELMVSSEDYEYLRVYGFEKSDLKSFFLARLFGISNEGKIVATFKDKIVGYANFVYTTAKEAGRILHICVHPEMRSMGVEELLIRAVTETIKRLGAEKVLATVSLRKAELISVLKHCGFDEKFVVNGMVLEIA